MWTVWMVSPEGEDLCSWEYADRRNADRRYDLLARDPLTADNALSIVGPDGVEVDR